jgi:hypothetical protein
VVCAPIVQLRRIPGSTREFESWRSIEQKDDTKSSIVAGKLLVFLLLLLWLMGMHIRNNATESDFARVCAGGFLSRCGG